MKVAIVTALVLIGPLRGKQEINELKNTCAWFHQWCLLSLDINTALNQKHNFYYILVRRNESKGFFRGLCLHDAQITLKLQTGTVFVKTLLHMWCPLF